MTPTEALETAIWASIQAAAVMGLAAVLARWSRTESLRDRLWRSGHFAVLLLTAAAPALPHPRLFAAGRAGESLFASSISPFWVWCVVGMWGSGAAALLVRLVVGGIGAWRALWNCRQLSEAEAATLIPAGDVAPTRMMFPVSIRFLISGDWSSPFCWQFHRPTIVLSGDVLDFPGEERDLIVSHELQHLRAGHPLHLFVQRVIEALYWFHPVIWWASWQAVRQREFACDAACAATRSRRISYLKSLLRLAESDRGAAALSPAGLSFLGQRSLIAQRAERLTKDSAGEGAERGWRKGLPALVVSSAALSLVLAAMVWRTPFGAGWWTAWPSWSAAVLMDAGVPVRDYHFDEHRFRPQEAPEAGTSGSSAGAADRSASRAP